MMEPISVVMKNGRQKSAGSLKKMIPINKVPTSTESGPYCIGCTNGQCLCGFVQQQHTDAETDEEANHLLYRSSAGYSSCFAEASSKAYFK